MKAKLKTFYQQTRNQSFVYCAPETKSLFHSQAKSVLRALAKELELPAKSYDIRSNMGGVAVSGEITLHAGNIYIQISESFCSRGVSFLVRSCKSRRDYTGGCNNFVKLENASEKLVETCKRILDNPSV